jgi:hypothetical protein
MDADGSNKTKVIDVSGCDNVQFIPNSDKLLYLANNSLYTVNIDGTENQKISGELYISDHLPSLNKNGDKVAIRYKYGDFINFGLFNFQTGNPMYLSNQNRREDYPKFSATCESVIFSILNDSSGYYEIHNFLIPEFQETILYKSNHNSPISECYLDDVNNKLYFTEATYRGNAKLVEFDLINMNKVIISDNVSIGLGNQTDFSAEFIAFPSYPDAVFLNLIDYSSIIYENSFWANFNEEFIVINKTFHLSWDSSIFIYNLNNLKKFVTKISHGYQGRVSKELNRICFIGLYTTNQKSKEI